MIVRILLLTVLLLASPAAAQTAAPTADDDEKSTTQQQELKQTRAMLGWELARRAVQPLRRQGEISREQFAFSAELLDIAADLAGDDPDLLRYMIEAASQAGDKDAVERGTARLTVADPDDQLAQLRLIAMYLDKRSSSEERLDAYQRLLGPAGDRLDPVIRSRLAYDAAVLWREQGDDEKFADYLTQAIQLDSTNKDAAALAVAYHAAKRPDEPVEHLELLLNLLYTDPVDSGTMLAVSRHLLNNGAYEQSVRFVRAAMDLLGKGQAQLDDSVFRLYVLAAWGAGKPDEALRYLDNYQDVLTTAERNRLLNERVAEIEKAKRFGEPYEPLDYEHLPFQDVIVDLPMMLDWLRLTIAAAAGHEAMADAAARRVIAGMDEQLKISRDAIDKSEKQSERDLLQADRYALISEAIMLRVLFNKDIEGARALFQDYSANPQLKQSARDRFEGWLLLREGKTEEAAKLLQAAGEDDTLAQIGLAVIDQQAGRSNAAAERYAAVWRREPGTQLGLYAMTRYELLLGHAAPSVSETADRMNQLAQDTIKDDLLRIWEDADKTVAIWVEPIRRELQYMDRPRLRVRMRNLSYYPLALGPEAPLSSRLMLVSSLRIDGREAKVPFSPVIVDLQRRLRLDPRRDLEVEVPLYMDQIWEAAASSPEANFMATYRGILDYSSNNQGQFLAGPMGTEALAEEITSFGVVAPYRTVGGVLGNLDKSWGVTRFKLLSIAAALIGRPPTHPEALTPEKVDELVKGLLDRFNTMTDEERAWLLVRTANMTRLAPDSPINRRAWEMGGEMTYIAYLATRAVSPEQIDLMRKNPSPRVRRVADLLNDVLTAARKAKEESADSAAGNGPGAVPEK